MYLNQKRGEGIETFVIFSVSVSKLVSKANKMPKNLILHMLNTLLSNHIWNLQKQAKLQKVSICCDFNVVEISASAKEVFDAVLICGMQL